MGCAASQDEDDNRGHDSNGHDRTNTDYVNTTHNDTNVRDDDRTVTDTDPTPPPPLPVHPPNVIDDRRTEDVDPNLPAHNEVTPDVAPVPEDDTRRHAREDETDTVSGLIYNTVDFRTKKTPSYHDSRPKTRGRLWVDSEFPLHIAIEEFADKRLEWKRPQEVTDSPVLFSEGTTRFDIGQGSAGTCWFLSMVANLSDHPELTAKVVSKDDYVQREGFFHSRFWKFGVWEDVYIDDCLPIIYGTQIWGAKSATDPNEMWVSLLEKAFAKIHGSYNSIYGGQSSDAYLALTGGIAERIDFDDHDVIPDQLFRRVANALHTGAMVSCTVPEKFDKKFGLVGGHAYSLTGAQKVQHHDGRHEQLLRVRNPWGNTEWNGRWSDESPEWDSIPPRAVERVKIDDGEFWISLEDFLTFFSQTTICSLMPDFDMDGCSDSLNHVLRVYGQWRGESAAGFRNRLDNPKYIFTVPDDGMTEEGYVPLVVQLIQKTQHRKVDKASVRVDLYKVLGSKTHGRPTYVLEMLGTETNVYSPSIQVTGRYRVEPGQYIILPSTIDAGTEKEFLIRIFAPCQLHHCLEVKKNAVLMSCDSEATMELNDQIYKLTTFETFFGAWVGRNAGGQISKRETHANNPQYVFTVPDRGGLVPVIFHLMQPQEEPQYPIGIRVYPLDVRPPVDINYLYEKYDSCPDSVEGGTFMVTWDLDVKYALPPGSYLLLVNMDEAGTEKEYCLHVRSSAHLNIRGYQTGV